MTITYKNLEEINKDVVRGIVLDIKMFIMCCMGYNNAEIVFHLNKSLVRLKRNYLVSTELVCAVREGRK